MAMVEDGTEVWVSSNLVAVDDMLGGEVNDKNGVTADLGSTISFPSEFPYEFDFFSESSALASPGESVQDSTESESSDEEDFLSALTRRLSQSSNRETRKLWEPSYACQRTEKTRGLAHSPQSTLSRMGSWSTRNALYSDRSPNSSSQLPSPPLAVKNGNWDVLYAVTGQVGRLKVTGEIPHKNDYRNREAIPPSRAIAPFSATKNPNNVVYSIQTLGPTDHRPAQMVEFNKLVREDQILKQQCSSVWARYAKMSWLTQPQQQQVLDKGKIVGYQSGHCARPHQAAWAQNQPLQHSRSAIGGIAHSGSLPKRECAGTGVFLPRHYGNNAEPRKTSRSPAVLPNWLLRNPDMVATKAAGFHTDHDAIMAKRNTAFLQQRRSWRQDGTANVQVPLPQEWTY